MRAFFTSLLAMTGASPAFAAKGPFISLWNTDFAVLIAFLLFVAVLVRLKVPSLLGGLLDKRAQGIATNLNEARAIREEAQGLLASYERKQKEVQQQADRIVEHARQEAAEAAEKAKADLQVSIVRRIKAAEDQIASAEANAVKEVRDRAITVAVSVAKEIVANQITETKGNRLIAASITEVGAKLH